jgi:cystathionine beta-lyase family protein involved in aluminum resistance
MARTVDIDAKIEQQEQKILKLKAQLEDAQVEYDKLVEKKKEADMKKILDAYAKSKRSMEEVIDFLKGKADI